MKLSCESLWKYDSINWNSFISLNLTADNVCVTEKQPFEGRQHTVTFEVTCVHHANHALSWQEKSGELKERTETRLNHLPRVAELNSAQSDVPPPSWRWHCPKQLQLTHTALWSGLQSVKVWAWVHRLRRWLVTATERSGKGLSAEHTGTQRVAFSSDEEQKGKLTELVFFPETFEQI